ncbi:MAG: sulfotransferase [Kiritimatiellia bacterium]
MRIVKGRNELRLPDFMIIGAPRSGTSSLYFHLRRHPEIFMPELKEPLFFNNFGKEVSPIRSRSPWTLEDYAELFRPASEEQLVGEASALYLCAYRDTINSIKEVYGDKYRDLGIIAILRNPVERAWSGYLLLKRRGHRGTFSR